MKLSIIIPAYNSEKFIEKCLLSCLNQDIPHNEYELIVVDDGSIDNTRNIVLSMKEKYNNIKYFYQENAAQGAARNNGLSKAKGKYIWFVDSDDWIEQNCLATIVNKLEKYHLTALLVGHATKYSEELSIWEKFDDNIFCSGKELISKNKFYISPTYAIWDKSYIEDNNLFFLEKTFHEDSEICPRMYYFAEKIGFIDRICYYVYPNLNSTTRGINPKRAYDIIKVVKGIEKFNNTIKEKELRQIIINYISQTINSSLYNSFVMDKEQILILNNLWFQNRYLFKILKSSNILKYKIEGILFIMFPKRICTVYKLMQLFNSNPGNMNKQKKLLHR